MPNKSLTIEQVLALLAETPRRIGALSSGLTPDQLRTKPGVDEWSANDVLAHLRSCADVWGDCIATIITEDAPTIRAMNPRTWITRTNYPDLRFRTSLRAFTAQRAALLRLLEPLPHKDWSRTATVTGAGKPLELTVIDYARRMAEHERPHLKQIARIVMPSQGDRAGSPR